MKLNRRQKKQKIDVFKILSFFLIFLIFVFLPTLVQKQIKIKKIECASQFGDCPDEFGFSLYLLSDYKTAKKEIEKALNDNTQINNFLIQYKIPATIKIEINIKKPKYAVSGSDSIYILDEEGLVLKKTDESNLPKIVKKTFSANIGDWAGGEEMFALKIVEKVAWLYSINEGVLEKDLAIRLNGGILVRFPLSGDVDTLVGSLRLIFSRLNDSEQGIKMGGMVLSPNIREIDLRFKNAIIR